MFIRILGTRLDSPVIYSTGSIIPLEIHYEQIVQTLFKFHLCQGAHFPLALCSKHPLILNKTSLWAYVLFGSTQN